MSLNEYQLNVEKFLNKEYPNCGGLLVLKTNLNSHEEVKKHMYPIVKAYYNSGNNVKDINDARAENNRLFKALVEMI